MKHEFESGKYGFGSLQRSQFDQEPAEFKNTKGARTEKGDDLRPMHERASVRDTPEGGPESRHLERDLERPSPKQQPTHGPKIRLAG